MDLKEIKKITAFARKSGIKTLEWEGFKIELHEAAILSRSMSKPKLVQKEDGTVRLPDAAEATLDQINQFIYAPVDEAV